MATTGAWALLGIEPAPLSKKITDYTSVSSSGLAISTGGSATCSFSLSAGSAGAATETLAAQPFTIDLAPHLAGRVVVPGSVSFTWGGKRYIDRLGKIYRDPDPIAGSGVHVGSISYATGLVTIDTYITGSNSLQLHSLLARAGDQCLSSVTFRTPGAPLRPGSFSVIGTLVTGEQFSATADFNGEITGPNVWGVIDVETGIVLLKFGEYVTAAGNEGEPWYDAALNLDNGTTWKTAYALADTINYTCVVYSYIPLDADLIGIDPVRLPTDGRVPIFRSGDIVVVQNSDTDQQGALSAGQVLTLSRSGVADVRIYDALGEYLPTTMYEWDVEAQQLTMADPLDLSGYTAPYVISHRIEDMRLVSEAQINGQLTFTAGLKNDYPLAGTYVSSALLFGDLQARLYSLFDQQTWTSVWSDNLIGNACTANYNDVDFPPVVTNAGAIQERWALVFDSTTHFNVIGEKVGVIADGYITNTLQPINPATGKPYFTFNLNGFGSGWSSGNVIRFNTDAANDLVWFARTTLSGEVTEPEDEFTLQIRGDAA